MPRLSVIICTFNPRDDYLVRALDALRGQTLGLNQWELLLIDNASSTLLAEKYDLSWHPSARHLREEKPGKMNAWHLGIKEARADILVFVDDDNVLAKDYLEQALKIAGERPFIGAWAGNVVPEFEKPLPAWIGDQAWRLTMVDIKEDIWSNIREDLATKPAGAGLCIRNAVGKRYLDWCAANELTMALDRSGKGLRGYGDIDLGHCALDLGLGTGKFASLRLTHLIAASRLTLDYFVRHAEGDAISLMLFRAVRGLPIQEPKPHSAYHSVRWFLHRMVHRVPREQFEIAKAHQRGLMEGWQLVQSYLQGHPSSPKRTN